MLLQHHFLKTYFTSPVHAWSLTSYAGGSHLTRLQTSSSGTIVPPAAMLMHDEVLSESAWFPSTTAASKDASDESLTLIMAICKIF